MSLILVNVYRIFSVCKDEQKVYTEFAGSLNAAKQLERIYVVSLVSQYQCGQRRASNIDIKSLSSQIMRSSVY
jgi:hypothetical protein